MDDRKPLAKIDNRKKKRPHSIWFFDDDWDDLETEARERGFDASPFIARMALHGLDDLKYREQKEAPIGVRREVRRASGRR